MRAVLAQAWAHYRQNFWLINALLMAIWTPAQFVFSYLTYHGSALDEAYLYQKLSIFYFQLIGVISTTGMLFVFRERADGYQPGFLAALGFGLKYWGRMFITRVVVSLLVFLGFALLVFPGVYLAVRTSLSESVVAAEGKAGAAAVRRSGELTRNRFGEILLWWLAGLAPILLFIALTTCLLELDAFNDWISQAILCSLQDFTIPMIYSLGWAIYSRVRKDETDTKSPSPAAPPAQAGPS